MSDPVENIFKSRRFKLFGVLDNQQLIKYIFGAHASLAIVTLILICVFLLKEASNFLPEHHHGLEIYRLTGKEYVDYLTESRTAHNRVYSALNRAYFTDVNAAAANENDRVRVFQGLKLHLEREAAQSFRALEAALERQEEAAEGSPEAAELAQEVEDLRKELKEESKDILAWTRRGHLDFETKVTNEEFNSLKEQVLVMQPGQTTEPDYIKELRAAASEKRAAALKKYEELKDYANAFNEAGAELKAMQSELRSIAMEVNAMATAYRTAPLRRQYLQVDLEQAEANNDAEKAQQLREEIAQIPTDPPDYDTLAKPYYATQEQFVKIATDLRANAKQIGSEFPKKAATRDATKFLKEAKRYNAKLLKVLERNAKKAEKWDHTKPYSFLRSVMQFFTGRDWITNSSWHDFYGVMPLFLGSMVIATIAITVAIPFSLGAAIYVNQLATKKEQDMVKPAIEFIEAIPSVVLGFFGIAVLGSFLREISQYDWLEWIPGFPMTERLNMLNAGLLLAFMALPTVFTLCEDALNNVPEAYTQASLAVGASKMQTVLGIVLPSALSGIVAAILLGFGRIIGETMVVLLVAGGKIAMPDWSLGIGIVTQATHTMTGIIAQELGEVSQGSEHWAALFMMGMILFTISLVINFGAQQIIKRFHHG